MTRLRVYVNPESRDILLVHAQEKKHADCALSAPWGAVTFQSGTPMCLARQRSRDSHWPVSIGKEGSPVTADTDRKPGCLDTYLT